MHPLTVYEITTREHERQLLERRRAARVSELLRERNADRPAPVRATTPRRAPRHAAPAVAVPAEGRPALA